MDREERERREGRISTDRQTIREWAEEHRAVPARYAGAEGESEEYRVVSESEVGESHERVEWDDFFEQLDEGDHVVVYHGTEASEPFEVTRRNEIVSRSAIDEEELENRLLEGEVVTSEITETTVVESVIVEEATVESELVDTEVVNERVVDVELLERECMGCTLVEEGGIENRAWFDEDRYLSSIGMGAGRGGVESAEAEPAETGPTPIESTDGVPYSVEFDVEEAWSVTREFLERFTVESRIAGTEVAETDTVEDRDIDVEGLHQSIAQSDLLDIDLTSDEVLSECEIQTEFAEGDRIQTQFKREHVVEEEVVDRKRLRAEVTGGDLLEMEIVRTQDLAAEDVGESSAGGAEAAPASETETGAEAGGVSGMTTLSEDEIGKTVVDTSGEEVGMITDVDESGEIAYVDAHPSITERIKAALDWGDANDDDYPVETAQIERITDDQVELKGAEEIDEGERHR